jgi:hypothetical protein
MISGDAANIDPDWPNLTRLTKFCNNSVARTCGSQYYVHMSVLKRGTRPRVFTFVLPPNHVTASRVRPRRLYDQQLAARL